MKYYVKRDDQEYGPFCLADLQRCIARGNIDADDLARGDTMHGWIPIAKVAGTVPAPPPTSAGCGGAPPHLLAAEPVHPLEPAECRAVYPALCCWFSTLLWSAFFAASGILPRLAL
jgi:hypothetical protein